MTTDAAPAPAGTTDPRWDEFDEVERGTLAAGLRLVRDTARRDDGTDAAIRTAAGNMLDELDGAVV